MISMGLHLKVIMTNANVVHIENLLLSSLTRHIAHTSLVQWGLSLSGVRESNGV